MNMLPNNLADFPRGKSLRDPGKPWRESNAPSPRIVGRLATTLLLLVLVGSAIGFGAYRLAVGLEEGSPPPPSLPTPAQDEVTPTDVALSSPADPAGQELVVTGLLGNQGQSQNWSGYAATEGGYTGVTATWTVPDIGLASPVGMDAAWVGIGGVRTPDLIQAGTQRTVLQNGATQQEAWIELLPRASETVALTLNPSDTIRVSIDQQGPETWLIVFTNLTSGQTFQATKRYASSLSSAEWVEEAPSASRRRTLPLDNFGTIHFSQASASRETQVLNISQSGAHAITMITPDGRPLAEPSALAPDGDGFSVSRTSTPSPQPQSSRRRP